VESWALAAVCLTTSGTPPLSTIRWRLEPCLLRSVGFGPVFSPPGSGHARRVERGSRPVDVVRLTQAVEQHPVKPPPHPSFVPLLKTPPACHPGPAAHLLREHLPRDTRLEYEQYARECSSVVHARASSLRLGSLFWQKRFYDRPQFVCYEWLRDGLSIPDRGVLLGALSGSSVNRADHF
jgi:hypothetical protein